MVIYSLVGTQNHVHNILRLFNVRPNFSFFQIFQWRALLAQGVYKLRALLSPLNRYVFYLHGKVKKRTKQIYDGVCLKMQCTRFDAPSFQLFHQTGASCYNEVAEI